MKEIKYTVKYRCHDQKKFTHLKDVVGDGIQDNFRFFALADETLIHVPWDAEVWFSPERAIAVRDKMSKEAGQQVQGA